MPLPHSIVIEQSNQMSATAHEEQKRYFILKTKKTYSASHRGHPTNTHPSTPCIRQSTFHCSHSTHHVNWHFGSNTDGAAYRERCTHAPLSQTAKPEKTHSTHSRQLWPTSFDTTESVTAKNTRQLFTLLTSANEKKVFSTTSLLIKA